MHSLIFASVIVAYLRCFDGMFFCSSSQLRFVTLRYRASEHSKVVTLMRQDSFCTSADTGRNDHVQFAREHYLRLFYIRVQLAQQFTATLFGVSFGQAGGWGGGVNSQHRSPWSSSRGFHRNPRARFCMGGMKRHLPPT